MKTIVAKAKKADITKRPAEERGQTELEWLHSRHTFSFGEYSDAAHNGFRSLRVLNEDIVEPGGGFGPHPHTEAEIFSYVVEGELQHKDSMHNGSVIQAGNFQYMSAGTGVLHSENNPSETKPLHFLQIWLRPRQSGGEPHYAEKKLGNAAKKNELTLVFSGQPHPEAVQIRQDADIYFGRLDSRRNLTLAVNPSQGIWVQVIRGEIAVLGETLEPGDGAAITKADELVFKGKSSAEFLVFVMG